MSAHPSVKIGNKIVGEGHPAFVAGEIGINHNGSMEITKKLIDGASLAGCDAVKFQKRTPEICVPKDQWDVERDTPWGRMRYIDYRHKTEFGQEEFQEIDRYCREKGMLWFASCWDEDSIDFIEQFSPLQRAKWIPNPIEKKALFLGMLSKKKRSNMGKQSPV